MFGLPATTPQYPYRGVEQCSWVLDQELLRLEGERGGNPHVIISGVDERSFLEGFVNSGEELLTKSWVTYDFHRCIVLLEMESEVHAAATASGTTLIQNWALGMTSTLTPMTAANIRGRTRSKKADASWKPAEIPSARDTKWPTMVLEVKWSEPRSKLTQDMLFWLHESNGDVKVALTLSVHRRGKITIEKWVLRQGQSSGPDPHPVETVEISRPSNRQDPPKITGTLTIPFKDVFLRVERAGETDLTLPTPVFEQMAREIWAVLDD
ncbi:uncharacterized protein N7482_003665 [Penicillium canariense]|uniref:Uncharacterized protein n=1 Tax=Penicillium canariense TaxID=189055 RepID=A0A9W9LPD1_9EURO|nr:uncharacterized protein N7482_003665 [Penicillium canariense]KAJ5168071.1 hypothetical protein N7482_003665 [Penicillium canariense]